MFDQDTETRHDLDIINHVLSELKEVNKLCQDCVDVQMNLESGNVADIGSPRLQGQIEAFLTSFDHGE